MDNGWPVKTYAFVIEHLDPDLLARVGILVVRNIVKYATYS